MRRRTRNTIPTEVGVWHVYRMNPAHPEGELIATDNYPTYGVGVFENIEDEPTPSLRSYQKRGQMLVKDLSHIKYAIGPSSVTGVGSGHLYNSSTGDWIESWRSTCSAASVDPSKYDLYPAITAAANGLPWESNIKIPFTSPLGLSTTQMLALKDAYARASEADLQGLVTLAESKKTLATVGSLVNTTSRIRNWYAANSSMSLLRRIMTLRRPANLWKMSKDVSNLWLEWRYGVRQLGFDIESMRKLTESYRAGDYAVFRSSRKSEQITDTGMVTTWDDGVYMRRKMQAWRRRNDVVTAGVIVRCDPATDFLRRAGLDKPFSSAWELVPFSFLVDWVLDVSGALSAFEGRYLRNPVASWVSNRCTYKHVRDVVWVPYRTTTGGVVYDGTSDYKSTMSEDLEWYTRTANPRFLMPALPEFKLRLNWSKVGDLIALLRQSRN